MIVSELFDATAQAAGLKSGAFTSLDIVDRQLNLIHLKNASLGPFVTVDIEGARDAARQSDKRRADGRSLGILDGITVAVKDMIATVGMPTTANSRVSPGGGFDGAADADCVRRLRQVGAIMIGKSTTYEYAAGLPDPDTGFAIPRNPWNPTRTASGSSTGSSIAVVTGMASTALGTDTGGSIRAPAATTGHTGFKPTTGAISTSGVIALSPSLDVVGPMARSARDCAMVFSAMTNGELHTATKRSGLSGLVVGLPRTWFWDHKQLQPEVESVCMAALEVMAELGAVVHDIPLENSHLAPQANHLIVVSEAFALHRARLRAHWREYGRHTRLTIARGAMLSASDYLQAQRFRRAYTQATFSAFQHCDVMATPTMPEVAANSTAISITDRMAMPNFVSPFNLAGLPAISIPIGIDAQGLPIALQIVGRPHADWLVLRVAEVIQQHTDWHHALEVFDSDG